ncbi:MAG: glycine cleavage system aminomethyltransferase GcvT [Candidatus Omnitrophica bacterium]|nr:glycine cleavage system aminomethyltransferase GcvT [Candidatus Omnitrophota bacterium]
MEDYANLKKTPLIENHNKLGARLAPFGGWLMPIQYSGIIDEHNWVRSSAGLFDICHMGEFEVEADLSKSNLEYLLTFNLNNMPCGSCRYGFMLNNDGGIIDDLVVYRISTARWMLVVNAATAQGDEEYLRQNINNDTGLKNISSETGKIDLQGPLSKKIIEKTFGINLDLEYYTFGYFKILGKNILISRTGYTGELGYELYLPAEEVETFWEEILGDERVKPAGLGARDTLRLEMGYSLYGQDIDNTTTPLEAGLSYFIDWDKEFNGKEALLKQKQEGLKRRIICFAADSRRAPRHNYRINYKGKEIGAVTSGSFSPSLGIGIGMGYVNEDIALGEGIMFRENSIVIKANITKRPFYKNGTVKYKEIKNACSG